MPHQIYIVGQQRATGGPIYCPLPFEVTLKEFPDVRTLP